MSFITPVRAALAGGAVAALATTVLVAGSAGASTGTSVSARLDHSVIHLGNSVSVVVNVAPQAAGQTVVLQQNENGQWHNVAKTGLSASSSAIFRVTPRSAGAIAYRVYRPAQHGQAGVASNTRTVHVQTLQQVTVADYSSGQRVWTGPRVYIPGATYRVDWANSCIGPQNGLIIDWNGDNSPDAGWETYYGVDNPAHSGTWYGHKGARSGYFTVSSPCHFTLHVSYQAWR